MNAPLPPAVLERIEKSLAAGRTIEAIQLYREATGAGLAEAKQAVERIGAGAGSETSGKTGLSGAAAVGAADASVLEQIKNHLFAGHKIMAIKVYRNATGKGLKESKEDMDRLEAELRQKSPDKFQASDARGCMNVVTMVGLGLGALVLVVAWVLRWG